jgi:hypothetical protein
VPAIPTSHFEAVSLASQPPLNSETANDSHSPVNHQYARASNLPHIRFYLTLNLHISNRPILDIGVNLMHGRTSKTFAAASAARVFAREFLQTRQRAPQQ